MPVVWVVAVGVLVEEVEARSNLPLPPQPPLAPQIPCHRLCPCLFPPLCEVRLEKPFSLAISLALEGPTIFLVRPRFPKCQHQRPSLSIAVPSLATLSLVALSLTSLCLAKLSLASRSLAALSNACLSLASLSHWPVFINSSPYRDRRCLILSASSRTV